MHIKSLDTHFLVRLNTSSTLILSLCLSVAPPFLPYPRISTFWPTEKFRIIEGACWIYVLFPRSTNKTLKNGTGTRLLIYFLFQMWKRKEESQIVQIDTRSLSYLSTCLDSIPILEATSLNKSGALKIYFTLRQENC